MKNKKLSKTIITCFMAVIISIGAYISFPVIPNVPFTMQVFFVFLTCFILEPEYALMAVLLYLVLGAAGMPVFSGGAGGFLWFIGPTGGFLTGFLFFPLATYIKKSSKFFSLMIALIIFYIFGIYWLSFITDMSFQAALYSVMVYIPLDFIKLILAYIVAKKIKKNPLLVK
ncbi:MAG: biotin transporter BioY [Candidatus Muiribacteriota bacterium]